MPSRIARRALPFSLAALLTVAFAGRPARADAPSQAELAAKLKQSLRVAVIERDLGWGLAGVGLAATAAGAVLLGTSGQASYDQGATRSTYGLIVLAAGAAHLIPGVVLAVVGQTRMTDLDWRLKAIASAPFVAPTRGGLTLGASFRF